MTISTLIVEDDFRVARLHADLVESLEGFRVAGIVHTGAAAISAAAVHDPDLVLLDLYLPDLPGLELLRRLVAAESPPEVIVLSAAREMMSVRLAMRRGALYYLIKPFDYDILAQRLQAYAQMHARRSGGGDTDQSEVDWMFGVLRRGTDIRRDLPKGCSLETAELILRTMRRSRDPLSTAEVAGATGVSRATAHRYLCWLVERGDLRLTLRYGTGRPEHRYEVHSMTARG